MISKAVEMIELETKSNAQSDELLRILRDGFDSFLTIARQYVQLQEAKALKMGYITNPITSAHSQATVDSRADPRNESSGAESTGSVGNDDVDRGSNESQPLPTPPTEGSRQSDAGTTAPTVTVPDANPNLRQQNHVRIIFWFTSRDPVRISFCLLFSRERGDCHRIKLILKTLQARSN